MRPRREPLPRTDIILPRLTRPQSKNALQSVETLGRERHLRVNSGQVSDYVGARALLSGLPDVDWPLEDRGCNADWLRKR